VGSSALVATTTAQILLRIGMPLLMEQSRRKVLLPHQLFVAVKQLQTLEALNLIIRNALLSSIKLMGCIPFNFVVVHKLN
jgi:hypothetical protein